MEVNLDSLLKGGYPPVFTPPEDDALPCECGSPVRRWRRRNTQYADDEQNWIQCCESCAEAESEYWQERWQEYYQGRL